MNEQYPDGKLNEQEKGELEMRMAIIQDRIHIEFKTTIKWIALSPSEAKDFALKILDYVNTIVLNNIDKENRHDH